MDATDALKYFLIALLVAGLGVGAAFAAKAGVVMHYQDYQGEGFGVPPAASVITNSVTAGQSSNTPLTQTEIIVISVICGLIFLGLVYAVVRYARRH